MAFDAHYDVIVAGGGIAGVAAALAAAECGARTALVEKTAFWGGLATAGMVFIYLPLCDGMGHQVSAGLAERLLKCALRYGPGDLDAAWQTPNPDANPRHPRLRSVFVPAAFILGMDEMLENAGVTLWLDTVLTGTLTDAAGRVTGVEVFNKGGAGRFYAPVVVDATGDAEIARNAGAEFVEEGNILAFWGMQVMENAAENRDAGARLSEHLRGVIHGVVDPTPNQRALSPRGSSDFLLSARRWLRTYYQQLSPDRHLHYPAILPALAQFRRSAHIVSRKGIVEDTHNQPLSGAIGMASDWCNVGIVQELPFSAMLPEKLENIIVAGRALDASGYGWELARSIPAVAVSGEAAGVAAALSARRQQPPSRLDVVELQNILRQRGGKPTLHDAGLCYRHETGYREPVWIHSGH